MTQLPDVNTLVALAWPNHVHHAAARAWFDEAHRTGWATCPMTQAGFVRVSSNRRVIPVARTVEEAAALLRELSTVGAHSFWADDVDWTAPSRPPADRIQGYRQVTDAHLVTLTRVKGGTVATFDRGVRDLGPDVVRLLSLV